MIQFLPPTNTITEKNSEQDVKDNDVKAAWSEYKQLVEDAMRQEAQDQVLCMKHGLTSNLDLLMVNARDNLRVNVGTVVHFDPNRRTSRSLRVFFLTVWATGERGIGIMETTRHVSPMATASATNVKNYWSTHQDMGGVIPREIAIFLNT